MDRIWMATLEKRRRLINISVLVAAGLEHIFMYGKSTLKSKT